MVTNYLLHPYFFYLPHNPPISSHSLNKHRIGRFEIRSIQFKTRFLFFRNHYNRFPEDGSAVILNAVFSYLTKSRCVYLTDTYCC